MNITEEKNKIRKKISSLKKAFSENQLLEFSQEVISSLESLEEFQKAEYIFCYYSMKDEVDTRELISKYAHQKKFILPVIVGDNLILKEYKSDGEMEKVIFGILEPQGEEFINYKKIDLVIVPGVAFDEQKNRLGRGKGYYDKILKDIKAKKIGICFDFQLVKKVPVETFDVKLDAIVSQNTIVI